jgi:hypothetical protein
LLTDMDREATLWCPVSMAVIFYYFFHFDCSFTWCYAYKYFSVSTTKSSNNKLSYHLWWNGSTNMFYHQLVEILVSSTYHGLWRVMGLINTVIVYIWYWRQRNIWLNTFTAMQCKFSVNDSSSSMFRHELITCSPRSDNLVVMYVPAVNKGSLT